MTVMNSRVLESFKLADFDVEYFVEEALKADNNSADLITAQLAEFLQHIDAEMTTTVKQCSDIILNVAQVSDSVIGELLSAREHIAVLRSALDTVSRDETMRTEIMKKKHALLKKALAVSQLLKRASRFTLDSAKLRAKLGDSKLTRNAADLSSFESVADLVELDSLAAIDVLRDDATWVKSLMKPPSELQTARSRSALPLHSSPIVRQATN
jgi:hypothetical protein